MDNSSSGSWGPVVAQIHECLVITLCCECEILQSELDTLFVISDHQLHSPSQIGPAEQHTIQRWQLPVPQSILPEQQCGLGSKPGCGPACGTYLARNNPCHKDVCVRNDKHRLWFVPISCFKKVSVLLELVSMQASKPTCMIMAGTHSGLRFRCDDIIMPHEREPHKPAYIAAQQPP